MSLLTDKRKSILEYEESLNCSVSKITKDQSCSDLKSVAKNVAPSRRSNRKSIMKKDTIKAVLVADPEIVEFRNCEARSINKKIVIVQNIGTQLARFTIKSRPTKSPFVIFIESKRGEKENVAPGMHVKLVVQYKCDVLTESEELLLLAVQRGKSVAIRLKAYRDPPLLKAVEQTHSTSFFTKRRLESSLSDSVKSICPSLSSKTSQFSRYNSSTKRTSSETDSIPSCTASTRSTFDCAKCFVGEFVIVSTVLTNIGGDGRFFIMSEMDWCFTRINDVTMKNILIASPFAFYPAYFTLRTGEQVTLYTYFFPHSYGLQVDELYIISDNCSLKTVEVVGDGIIFEPQLLQFDNSIKYEWFETSKNELCTIRYLNLSYNPTVQDLLIATFTIVSKCGLSLHYRWEISGTVVCPEECKYTISSKTLSASKLKIQPNYGVFQSNSITTFTLSIDVRNLASDRYTTTLQLIVEDVPFAAIPKKYNFSHRDSITNRRLCENTVDVFFQKLQVRLQHDRKKYDGETNCNEIFRNISLKSDYLIKMCQTADMNFPEIRSLYDNDFPPNAPEFNSSRSDEVCRFVKGYGTCDCKQATMISTAVIRPHGALFVGSEETFFAIVRNKSSRPLKYWWGNVVGSDRAKIRIQINPKFDRISPYSSQTVRLNCLPLETGNVTSIFIPCQFEGTSSLVLSLECVIKSLSVSFHFPLYCDDEDLSQFEFSVDWNSDNYLTKYDMTTGEIELFKLRLKEERFIHTVNLNSGESLESTDTETITSHNTYENQEDVFNRENVVTTEHYGKVNNNSNDIFRHIGNNKNTLIESDSSSLNYAELSYNSNFLHCDKESFTDTEKSIDMTICRKLLPHLDIHSEFIRKHFRYIPLVIEFHLTSEETRRKRIYIKNESPIASCFAIYTRHAWSDDDILTHQELLIDERDELMTGIALRIEPLNGKVGPYETVFFDVIASSNTWGVYTDEITVNIDLLPPYTFWVRIVNNSSPIYYPICRNSARKIPKLRFDIFKPEYDLGRRKLLVENTSSIPLYVNWHCFSIDENIEEKPFSLIFEMFTPFIGIDDFFLTNPTFFNAVKRFISCAANPYQSNGTDMKVDEDIFETDQVQTSRNISPSRNNLASSGIDFLQSLSHSDHMHDSSNNSRRRDQHTEFQLSLVPYCGESRSHIFQITPQELFIPPKQKRYVYISLNTDKIIQNFQKIICKLCGFIRIPPAFKYKDRVFFRQDSYFLPPTEVYLEYDIRSPDLLLLTDKSHRTYVFFMKDFLQSTTTSKLNIQKKLFLKNNEEETVELSFDISKPFEINCASTKHGTFRRKLVNVHPGDSVEILIKCSIDKDWITKSIELNRSIKSNSIHIQKNLIITYKEEFTKIVPLFIQIHLPSLTSSTNYLTFGKVILGESKSLINELQNMLERSQHFQIQRTVSNNIFTFYPTKGVLAAEGIKNMDKIEVIARFIPKNPGIFKETVDIVSDTDGLVSKWYLEGLAYWESQ